VAQHKLPKPTRILEKLASTATGRPYRISDDLAGADALDVLVRRASESLRGLLMRRKLRRSTGPLFAGKRVTIRHGRQVAIGRSCVFGDDVILDALGRSGISLGDRVSIGRGSTLTVSGVVARPGAGIKIGSRVGINEYCHIGGQGGVEIGDDVIFGPGVRVFSEDHQFDDPDLPIRDQGERRRPVSIGEGSWVGAGAIITAGVTIGAGAVVAAGSVVTRDVEAKQVVAGVPARLLRERI
jgi:acetyltransferase-like isoleucine patch superfamily enzyme